MLEEITYKPLAKFKVLEEPLQIPPMKCIGCGRYGSGDPAKPLKFIDMGFDVEFHGELFICVEGCFREIMNQLGVLTREQTLKLQDKVEGYEIELDRIKQRNEELLNAVGSLNRAGAISTARSSLVSSAREENQPVISTRVNQKSSRRKEGPTEPVDVGGSTVLSDSPGDDLLSEL